MSAETGSGKESSLDFGNVKALKKKEQQDGDGEHEGQVEGSVRSQALDALRVRPFLALFNFAHAACNGSVNSTGPSRSIVCLKHLAG